MTLLSILSFQLHQSFMAMMAKPVKTLELHYPIISFPTSENGIYCFIKNTPKILKNNCNHSKNLPGLYMLLNVLLFSIAEYFYGSKYKQRVKILSDTTQLDAL